MERLTGSVAQRVAAWSGYPVDRVLGTADVARRFGVTRQRVGQISREHRTFPRPGLHGRHGEPAWVAAGIECWAAAHRPTADTGRFGPNMAALLSHAELVAARIGHRYVEATHMWHAVASGAAGRALCNALRSMGLDPAVIEEALRFIDPALIRATRSRRMTPAIQQRLEVADKSTRSDGEAPVAAIDFLLACIDEKPGRHGSTNHLIWYAERRGLDTTELRRRLVIAAAEPQIEHAFPMTPLPKRRPRGRGSRRRPAGLEELLPNPLGHDPWDRQPWGSGFARDREGRHLTLDDWLWFFYIDADGYYVRTADGRPVGYRYRVFTKVPKRMPGRPKTEVLPMPPFPLMDWPDGRYVPEE